jgi:TonB family protein
MNVPIFLAACLSILACRQGESLHESAQVNLVQSAVEPLPSSALSTSNQLPCDQNPLCDPAPEPPRVLSKKNPVLRQPLQQAGDVTLEVIVSPAGKPTGVKVVADSTRPPAGSAVASAVREWLFEPSRLRGKPIEVRLRLVVHVQSP